MLTQKYMFKQKKNTQHAKLHIQLDYLEAFCIKKLLREVLK